MTVAHVAVNVTDWERSKEFYERTLAQFGYRVVYEEEGAVAYFADAAGLDFGIGRRDPVGGAHVAFECPDREAVDTFYENALAAGARDNGPPGIRATYYAGYYAAYVLDLDGNNIEAVCHEAPA
jgi:catechol 2,3-dioxygenase-like lactoylglutathione lyase family enzyme